MAKLLEVAFQQDHFVILGRNNQTVQYGKKISLGCGGITFDPPTNDGVVAVKRITGSKKSVALPWTVMVGNRYDITADNLPKRR